MFNSNLNIMKGTSTEEKHHELTKQKIRVKRGIKLSAEQVTHVENFDNLYMQKFEFDNEGNLIN